MKILFLKICQQTNRRTGLPANRPTGQLVNRLTGKPANRIAQSSIETTVALVVFFMLFVATVKVFVFFTERLAVRQRAYEDTRVEAGSGPRDLTTAATTNNTISKEGLAIDGEVTWHEPVTQTLHIFKESQ